MKKHFIKLKSQPKWIVRVMFGIGIIAGLVMAMYVHPIVGTNAQGVGSSDNYDEEIDEVSIYDDTAWFLMGEDDPEEVEEFYDELDGEKDENNVHEIHDNGKSNSHELTTFEKAFQEVAYAYYMRGTYLHYNVAKGKTDELLSPEESTC